MATYDPKMAHKMAQYAFWGISSATTEKSFTFKTISNKNYTALLYCYSTDAYFYPMAK